MLAKRMSAFVVAVAMASSAYAGSCPSQAAHRGGPDIIDTAVSAGSFKTLAAALTAGDLIHALKGTGPFTVFAPTDEAFSRLPKGTVETLLKPENKSKLVSILKYHVVSGSVMASHVVKLSNAPTLNGQRIGIQVADGSVKVNDSKVVKTDIKCSNGVIHVIDSVLLPTNDNIPTIAKKAGTFSTLLAAAKAAGLVDALSGGQDLTVFAPTDDAFGKLPSGTVESLLKPENRDQLVAILKYHVVPGRVYSDQVLKAGRAKTLQGGAVTIAAGSGEARVNDAKLVVTDLDASNGVIHVIDSVLLPPKKAEVSAVDAMRMIEHAVHRGVSLYNSGHHASCANVYGEVAHKLLQHGGDRMPPMMMTSLRTSLDSASAIQCASSKAWTLRHGLDAAYASLASAQ